MRIAEPNVETVFSRRSDPTLRDLLAPIFRRKRLLVLIFCGVMAGTGVGAFILANSHKASMEILVNHDRTDPSVSSMSVPGQATSTTISDAVIGSEIELLKSPDLLTQVVIANRLHEDERRSFTHYFHPGADDAFYIARATEHLQGRLDIQAVPKTFLIQVSYTRGSPKLAYNVLQTLGKLYLERHNAVHRPQGSYAFFASETEKYQQALADSEARLANFTKTTGIAAPDLQRAEMSQKVVDSIAALHIAQQTIAGEKHRIQDVKDRMKITPERSLNIEAIESAQALMQQLQSELLSDEIKKSQLLMKYEPSYPLVVEADQEIEMTKAAIVSAAKKQYINQTTDRDPTYELMREDIAKTEADLAFHQATAGALGYTIHSLQAQMVDLDQNALQLSDLNRQVKANEANYLLYLSKREQERTSDALDEKHFANVAIAVPPVLPILPLIGPVLIMFVGLVLAAFVSAGAAFVAEYLNPSLRTPDEVLEVLRIPVLASVPKQSA
jgi:uncharacterized protein involved in exopolysaccharide biosynthesis